MLPVTKRQGSDVFQIGSSMYAMNHDVQSESNSPISSAGVASALPGLYPYDSSVSLGFHQGKVHKRSGRADRFLSGDLGMETSLTHTSTGDPSPISRIADDEDLEMDIESPIVHTLEQEREHHHALPPAKRTATVYQDIPTIRLGDEGRSKLKSALSEKVRQDQYIRHRVEAIGKIRLASMQMLLVMAKEAGLYDYAIRLAEEHELAKAERRST